MDRGKAIEILESIKDGTACLMPNMPQIGNEAVDMAIEALKHPEIVYCKDCANYSNIIHFCLVHCDHFNENYFCGGAERRTDE